MNKSTLLIISAFLLLSTGTLTLGAKNVYDIRDFGAKPGGKSLCTPAIQQAIDKCAANGGGKVYLPPGTWLTGTLYLESHVTILLDTGSTLLGSKNKGDYGLSRKLQNSKDETFS